MEVATDFFGACKKLKYPTHSLLLSPLRRSRILRLNNFEIPMEFLPNLIKTGTVILKKSKYGEFMDRQNSSRINKSLSKFPTKAFSSSKLKLRIKTKNSSYEIAIELM